MESGVSCPSSSSHDSGRYSHSRSSFHSPPSLRSSSFTCSPLINSHNKQIKDLISITRAWFPISRYLAGEGAEEVGVLERAVAGEAGVSGAPERAARRPLVQEHHLRAVGGVRLRRPKTTTRSIDRTAELNLVNTSLFFVDVQKRAKLHLFR